MIPAMLAGPVGLVPAVDAPSADFSDTPLWLSLVKALLLFVYILVSVLLVIWFERRVIGRMQQRPGPNRTGPFGLLQSLADGMKSMLKEDVIPKGADLVMFILAPLIVASMAFVGWSIIPLGPDVRMFGHTTPLQMTDAPIAVLIVLAAAGISAYGFVLAGWSSGSTYPLLGGLRASAQVISYEIAMGLALAAVFLHSGSMSTSQIVAAQERVWFVFPLFFSFVIYLITMVGETNRLPFDLAEGEGELVGGYFTEYSGMKFAMFFLGEYINMFTVSALATTLFLGGWRAPWPLGTVADGMLNTGWWPLLWFTLKMWLFMFMFVWLRGSLPRVRYDQFMAFGWKFMIPATLVWVIAVAVIRGAQLEYLGDNRLLASLITIAVIGGLVMAVAWRWDLARDARRAQRQERPDEIDPFAGGYPVPPLPGQRLVEPATALGRGPAVGATPTTASTTTVEDSRG